MMADERPKEHGSKKLFNSPVLEKLTRTHIAIPLSIFSVFSVALLYWSITHTSLTLLQTAGMFFLGVIIFTWVEYNVHRFLFHMPTYTRARANLQYIMHGVHHEFPKDKDRLAMPPLVSVTIAIVLLLFSRLLLGDFAFSFLPGFIVGYAGYLAIHYMVHAFQPPKNFFKVLWRNHAVHHYKDGDLVFGVSSPLWDYIYGTARERKRSV